MNTYDDSGKQIRNKGPYFSNTIGSVPAGTELTLTDVGDIWAAVYNKLGNLGRNERLEKLDEADGFTFVRTADGEEGWAQTNFLRYDVEEEKDGIPADWARVFMNTTLNAYPSAEVWVSVADLDIPEHAAGAKEFSATTAVETSLHSEQTELAFWFGTNSIGQDLWARVWSGTRTSLFIGVSVGVICALIGILMGAIWGYVRKLDRIFTEIYNVWENIPYTVLRILITYILRPSLSTIIFVMCLTGWLGMARFVRNQIVIIRDREYNLASRCLGTGTWRMIYRNLLPYLVSVIMLRTALAIPEAIGTEVFLTYIGLGLPVSMPSLGNLINEGRLVMTDPTLTYQLIFPAVIVSIITMSFYALGNAFSDAADPRNHV
ncbi:ABC transporter permease subunit [Eubacteriales bacterium OttesenSCG-928-A19]|nr:ABC transporter permease subunit [Eubacteriales bacterium OttesenSCG-928-A19]